jgi:hypothetical protein
MKKVLLLLQQLPNPGANAFIIFWGTVGHPSPIFMAIVVSYLLIPEIRKFWTTNLLLKQKNIQTIKMNKDGSFEITKAA